MIALLLIFAGMPSQLGDVVVRDDVQVIEVNHCHHFDSNGCLHHSFTQIIFWVDHWQVGPRGPYPVLRVAKWWMWSDEKDLDVRVGRVRWKVEAGIYHEVHAPVTVTTWTHRDDDPEVLDRQKLPMEARRGVCRQMETSID